MENLLKRRILFLLLVAMAVSVIIGGGLALLTKRVTISSTGTIKALGIGIYSDKECTHAVSSFNWGLTEPGMVREQSVYIRNEGNVEASLYLETENWDPSEASDYIVLSWDYSGQIIKPTETIQVTFSLSISDEIDGSGITAFDFDIVISYA